MRIRRLWLTAFIAATAIAVLIATQNRFMLARAGRDLAWSTLVLGELPVWYFWLACAPLLVFLARRFSPVERPRALHLAVHVAAGLGLTFVMIALATAARLFLAPALLPPDMTFVEVIRRGFLGSYVVFLPIYGLMVAGILAWRLQSENRERMLRESALDAELAEARLEALRAQLQPHFLFNTLHAISALMGEDVAAARRMMRRLSDLLRAALEEGPHAVTLSDELEFVTEYVEIQKMRFGARLSVRYDIEPEARAGAVPRFVLQPLVENAIRHSTDGPHERGDVVVAASVDGERLRLEIADNGPGFPEGGVRRLGVGLRNTEARLAHLYGGDHTLRMSNRPDGGALIRIDLPMVAPPTEDGHS